MIVIRIAIFIMLLSGFASAYLCYREYLDSWKAIDFMLLVLAFFGGMASCLAVYAVILLACIVVFGA